MKVLLVSLAFLVIFSHVERLFAETGDVEEERRRVLSIHEWERRGYQDGKEGSAIGLSSTVAASGICGAGGCCLLGAVGGCAGGSVGCLGGLAVGEITAPHASTIGLSREGEVAYMRGFDRARSDTRKQAAAVGGVITAVWALVGLGVGILIVAGAGG